LADIDSRSTEVVFTPRGDNAATQHLSRLRRQGALRPLYREVFSANLRAEDADVVRRNWSRILGYLAPGCVVSHRSAFDTLPADGALYFSRADGRREFVLPGVAFKGLAWLQRARRAVNAKYADSP
jgi:hypothetical protein